MIIVKETSHSTNWAIYHIGTGNTNFLKMNDTAATEDTDNWQDKWLNKEDYIAKGYTFKPVLFWAYTTSLQLLKGYWIARKKEKANG